MNKKNLKIVVIFIFIMFIALGGVLWYRYVTNTERMRGQYTFTRVRQEIKNIGKIVMTTPRSGTVTVYRDHDVWRFKEASDYFVNMKMLSNFYTMINGSVITSVQKAPSELLKKHNLLAAEESDNGDGEGTEVAVYDNDGQLLDDIILGDRDSNDETFVFARPKGKNYIYVVSNIGRFSGEAQAWIPYPLLQVLNQHIESIDVDGVSLNRQQLTKLTYDSIRIRKMLDCLAFLNYQGIAKKDDFFASAKDVRPKQIIFNMIGGLIYVFRIYSVNGDYWLGIDLKTASLAHKEIAPFVENNQKYFSDWVFQLFDDEGEILYEE
ncbi:MAG: DUF4340 domain-containing protein [Alphaproteobacteria bacterium]|nr:DUF4340 domain-containing protein [Alphaproteobacteria bacterium]